VNAVDIHLGDREIPSGRRGSHGDPFGVEFTIALSVVRFRRKPTASAGRPRHFSHEPEDAIEFARVLGCPIRARASWSGWAMSRAALTFPLRRRDRFAKMARATAADILAVTRSSRARCSRFGVCWRLASPMTTRIGPWRDAWP
jgi:hypothetical protein